MAGEQPSSGPQSGTADDLLCVAALRAIALERAVRARRRHDTAPTQAGFLVAKLVDCRPGDASLAGTVSELVALGPRGLEELTARFPGPLWRDPRVERDTLPSAAEVGPLPMALRCFGQRAHPVLVGLLQSRDPEDRLCAAALAPDFASDDVLDAVTELTLHGDPDARRMAGRALRDMGRWRGYPRALDRLRSVWSDPASRTLTRLRALQALANLGDATLVPELVEALHGASGELSEAAHEALVVLTAHDFGSSRALWRFWLARRGRQPRHTWLLRGLRSRRGRLRQHALAGLSRLLDRRLDPGPTSDRQACRALADALALELVDAEASPTG